MHNLTIIKKDVNYLRLTIKTDQTIHLTAPLSCSDKKIQEFLQKKEKRIHTKLLKLEYARTRISLTENEILLHGKAYKYIHDKTLRETVIDHDLLTLSSPHHLLTPRLLQKRYRSYAKTFLTQRIDHFSQRFELPFHRLYIRNQTTKRGTCSARKNIGLNRRLVQTPLFVTDYIICHELAHLRHMNHSKKFRNYLDSLFPNKQRATERIQLYGSSLW